MADAAATKTRAKAAQAAEAEAPPARAESPAAGSVEDALAELHHKRRCPATGQRPEDPSSRVEVIRHRVSGAGLDRERGGDTDGLAAIVVRCVECGAQYPEE